MFVHVLCVGGGGVASCPALGKLRTDSQSDSI